jgi:3-deoxy-7-phosphoheptulonate synthase
MAGGNKNIILCECGIRTFSDYTKATLDIAAIPLLKELSQLPVIADASRSTGLWRLTGPVSRAICAAGADGLIIDVHSDPPHAAFNGNQAVTEESFAAIAADISRIHEVITK